MSRIYFTSPSGSAELRGSERAHMGILACDLTAAAFAPNGWRDDPLFRVTRFRAHDYTGFGDAARFRNDFSMFLAGYSGDHFAMPDGQTFPVFGVCLNTVLAIGSDPLCLLARLHGQCEIHTWVEGPNRAWLAGLIEQGRTQGVMRPSQGWEAVAAFLRASDAEPVVTSYSVTDSFPNPRAADWEDDRDGDGWYDLPDAEQWSRAMTALRAADDGEAGLEMQPDRWRYPDYFFGAGANAFTILEAAAEPQSGASAATKEGSAT